MIQVVRIPATWAPSDAPLIKSLRLFPLVGLMIGALLTITGTVVGWLWGDSVRAVAVVVVWGIVTAGLHLDGLSDTFDGVMSWRPRERKLEIMRDSRIGVMGALALAAILGLKVALLFAAGTWMPALLLAPALGGLTGDTYGALCEIGEVIALAALTARV
jgi:adenosylcobinamide-GDP ribazoletransferase